jgi:adenine-specific DNA-methyltransferase
LPKGHPSKKWSRYKRVDKNGPWRDRDISWPGGDGPRYDVLHDKTKLPCKVPERGWIYSDPKEMQRQIDLGLVEFRDDHTEPPFRKFHIKPVGQELADEDETDFDGDEETADEEELATQVRGSVFYKQSQVSVRYLRDLMGPRSSTTRRTTKNLPVCSKTLRRATKRRSSWISSRVQVRSPKP